MRFAINVIENNPRARLIEEDIEIALRKVEPQNEWEVIEQDTDSFTADAHGVFANPLDAVSRAGALRRQLSIDTECAVVIEAIEGWPL